MKVFYLMMTLALGAVPVNAQLDKVYAQQKKEKAERERICLQRLRAAQYKGYRSLSFGSLGTGDIQLYIDPSDIVWHIGLSKSYPHYCKMVRIGILDKEFWLDTGNYLLKKEGNLIVEYHQFTIRDGVTKAVIGTKK